MLSFPRGARTTVRGVSVKGWALEAKTLNIEMQKEKGFVSFFDKQMFVYLCYTESNERANASAVIYCRSALGWTVHNDDGVPRLVCAMLARSSPSWNE